MPVKFLDLEPVFLTYESRVETYQVHKPDEYMKDPKHVHIDACWENKTGPKIYMNYVQSIDQAQGVSFLCPKCFIANGSRVGTHAVICWSRSRGVPDDASPGPGRWKLDGTGLHDLTLNGETGGARSVQLNGGCKWHGFITNGEAT